MDAGANASALPAISVASLVGFGAVVAAMPAFAMVRDAVLGNRRRPARVACGRNQHPGGTDGLRIRRLDDRAGCAGRDLPASEPRSIGMDPALLHRVAVIGVRNPR